MEKDLDYEVSMDAANIARQQGNLKEALEHILKAKEQIENTPNLPADANIDILINKDVFEEELKKDTPDKERAMKEITRRKEAALEAVFIRSAITHLHEATDETMGATVKSSLKEKMLDRLRETKNKYIEAHTLEMEKALPGKGKEMSVHLIPKHEHLKI